MGKLSALIKKELQFYLNSAVAYVVVVLFLVVSAVWFFFVSKFLAQNVATLRDYFGFFPVVFVFVIPALTMRSWSEEMRVGTYEILLTMPYPQWKLVLAKFLSPLILIAGMLVLTFPLPISLSVLGNFEFGLIVTQYVGVLLMATASVAVGTYISSRTKNQIIAFLVTLIILFATLMIGILIQQLVMPVWLTSILSIFSLFYHFDSFVKGLLDSRDVLFFLIVSALFLFLCERRLLLRKWR